MIYAANPLQFYSVMLVPGSPAVIWNTPWGTFVCCEAGTVKSVWLPTFLKGFWGTVSKVDPLQCVAGAPLRHRSGDPAPTRICCVAEFFKSVCFPNVLKRFWETVTDNRPPKCGSGASEKTLVFLCFPNGFAHARFAGGLDRRSALGARWARSDLLGSGILQKCFSFQ